MNNKILQIGSGSMGSRRMRDLSARGDLEIALFDTDEKRRQTAHEKFGVRGFAEIEEALAWKADSMVISTPPHLHAPYVEIALREGMNFFCECDLWPYSYREIQKTVEEKGLLAAPSLTMYFLPLVQELKRVVGEELGDLHAYQMCLSVNAPAWHPNEGAEYYARHRKSAPGREMVPFELAPLSLLFGNPVKATGTVRRRGQLEMDSEDTWCLQMTLESGATGQLTVLMASPQVVRTCTAVGTNGALSFDLIAGNITRQFPALGINDTRNFGGLGDVMEATYAREINAFIDAARGDFEWPFNYLQSSILAGTLAAAEKSALGGRSEKVSPDLLPAEFPDSYDVC